LTGRFNFLVSKKESYKPIDVAGKRILVFGLGLHGGGVATTRWLIKHGAKVTVTDLKTAKLLAPSLKKLKGLKFTKVLGGHRAVDVKSAEIVVQNPAVPSDSPYLKQARKLNIPIINEATLFFWSCPVPIIGVTGTKGKSTVVAMIHDMLSQNKNQKSWLAGNIAKTAMLDILDKVKNNDKVVLELSSWQLENLSDHKLSPHVAVITNVLRDHLNRYSNFLSYIRAKQAIFKHQQAGDVAVINFDNSITKRFIAHGDAQRMWFSGRSRFSDDGAYIKKGSVRFRLNGQEQVLCPVVDLALPGQHNLENALAATTAGLVSGASVAQVCKTLKSFKGLADRLEFVRNFKNVAYYNDTTATTPDATMAALETVGATRPIVLIAGGEDKKLKYSSLIKIINKEVKAVVLLPGSATEKIRDGLKITRHEAANMPAAVQIAAEIVTPGDAVVMSPAAASFGLFVNEFDRGMQFKRAARRLK
tara:strand:+ start:426 stop:1850 length:1425 start_codon:yes stop_codon:yes gene_type:complete